RFAVRAPLIWLEDFLGSVESGTSLLYFTPHHSWELLSGFAYSTSSLLGRTHPSVRITYPPASPYSLITIKRWYRNINLLSIAYAFRPQLRSRLTLRGRAFLMKPSAFGERASHSFFVTHIGILTSTRSTTPHALTLHHVERAPTTVSHIRSTLSVVLLAS